jgi:hypothetical protein
MILGLFSCNSKENHDYEYLSLNSYSNDTSSIATGKQVKLLAFSGGKDNDKDNIYYQQIIVTTENPLDTFTIICPLFKIPNPDATTGRLYITPLEFNPEKKVLNAVYERKSDSLNLLLQYLGDVSESENQSTNVTNFMNSSVVKNELVAVNKTLPVFQNKYKTVVGILKFDTDPR